MSSFHTHVLSRLAALLDTPRPGASQEWSPSAVSVRVLHRAPGYLSSRLGGRPNDAPLLVRDASAIVASKGLGAGVLLGGEITDRPFVDIVYGRLLGLISVAGLPPRALQRPAVASNASRASWARHQKLTCDEVDAVLAHLGLPLGAMFAPALGPYDASLLAVLATREDATGARATRSEVEIILAGYRGETRASRPVGSHAGGAQLTTAGCSGAVRRMIDQALLEVAEPGARPPHDVIRVTAAGRAVASRPVTRTPNPEEPAHA